jgi:hypothetical protein
MRREIDRRFSWPRRTVLTAVVTVALSVVGAAPALATPPSALPSGWQLVSFAGVSVQVPASWPIYDLRVDPARCVRMDAHAVFLGTQGANASCPAHLTGKTEAAQIHVVDPHGPGALGATQSTVINGQPLRTDPHFSQASSLTDVFDSAGVQVDLPYRDDPALARRIESSLRVSGRVSPATPPRGGAPLAIPSAVPQGFVQGQGFDACSAPSVGTMQAWLASPYRSVGVYIGGANRACPQPNLTAAWITAVEGQGWHPFPIYVGLQAPCVLQRNNSFIDPAAAANQGTQAADDAVNQAGSLGLTAGTTIYDDMEAYGAGCTGTVLTFLNSYTNELHNRGYTSGLYESASNFSDVANGAISKPDQIFYANWDNRATTAGDPFISDSAWNQHQRIHQYRGGHEETWGGALIGIDNDQLDATLDNGALPVAAPVRVATVSSGPGRLDAFVKGPQGHLYHRGFDGTGWGGWDNLDGDVQSYPAAVSAEPGRLDVFVKGPQGHLYHRGFDGTSWSGWDNLGGDIQSEPAATSSGPGHVDVFVKGPQGHLYHLGFDYRTNGWGGWDNLQGDVESNPAATSSGTGRLDAFVKGPDGHLYHMGFDGTAWGGWDNLEGDIQSDPAVTSSGPGRLDAFVKGPQGHLYHRGFDGTSWGGWDNLEGDVQSDPAATSSGTGHADVFVKGPQGHLYHRGFDGTSWSGWDILDGDVQSDPAATSSGPGRLDAFVRGPQGHLYHRGFDGTGWGGWDVLDGDVR